MDQMPPRTETQIVQPVQVAGMYSTKKTGEETPDSMSVRQRIQSLEDISSHKNLPEVLQTLKENCEAHNKELLELTQKYKDLALIVENKVDKTNPSLSYEILQVNKMLTASDLKIYLLEDQSKNANNSIKLLHTRQNEIKGDNEIIRSRIDANLEAVMTILNKQQQSYQKKLTIVCILNFLGFGASFALFYYLWQHTHK